MSAIGLVDYRTLQDNLMVAVESYSSKYINKCKNGTVGIYDKVRFIMLRRYASYVLNRLKVYHTFSPDTLYKKGDLLLGNFETLGDQLFTSDDDGRLYVNQPEGWYTDDVEDDGNGGVKVTDIATYIIMYLNPTNPPSDYIDPISANLEIGKKYRLQFDVYVNSGSSVVIKLDDLDGNIYTEIITNTTAVTKYLEFETTDPDTLYFNCNLITAGVEELYLKFDFLKEITVDGEIHLKDTSKYFKCYKDTVGPGLNIYNRDYFSEYPSFTYNYVKMVSALNKINRICGSNLTI